MWDKSSKKHVRQKYRISEPDVAQSFIDATRHFKDEVYSRTADLTSQKLVTAADLFYHRHCLRTYTGRYERERSSKSEVAKPKPVNRKEELFYLALTDLDQRINEGMGFTMTEIREYICSLNKDPEPVVLYNCDVKKLLQDHYGGKIQFALNPQKNKSELVFLSSISPVNVAAKISNINLLKAAGESLWMSTKTVDFGLEDSFCDSQSLG